MTSPATPPRCARPNCGLPEDAFPHKTEYREQYPAAHAFVAPESHAPTAATRDTWACTSCGRVHTWKIFDECECGTWPSHAQRQARVAPEEAAPTATTPRKKLVIQGWGCDECQRIGMLCADHEDRGRVDAIADANEEPPRAPREEVAAPTPAQDPSWLYMGKRLPNIYETEEQMEARLTAARDFVVSHDPRAGSGAASPAPRDETDEHATSGFCQKCWDAAYVASLSDTSTSQAEHYSKMVMQQPDEHLLPWSKRHAEICDARNLASPAPRDLSKYPSLGAICPRCGKRQGEWCVDPQGDERPELHHERRMLTASPAPRTIFRDEDCEVKHVGRTHPGGQHVGTMGVGITATHTPTGITVTVDSERSQLRNKQLAIEALREKVVAADLASPAPTTPQTDWCGSTSCGFQGWCCRTEKSGAALPAAIPQPPTMQKNVEAQEEVVCALWDFARALGIPKNADTTRPIMDAVKPALERIMAGFHCRVTEIQ